MVPEACLGTATPVRAEVSQDFTLGRLQVNARASRMGVWMTCECGAGLGHWRALRSATLRPAC